MRYIVFGDTGGHYIQLMNGLVHAGMDEIDLILPDDVIVVHVGDLVHKGPDTHKILHMIDTVREKNPGQWLQLIGNHEFQYLGGPNFWAPGIDNDCANLLFKWKEEGFLQYAAVIPENAIVYIEDDMKFFDKNIVLTHAGIGKPFYDNFLKGVDPVFIPEFFNKMSVRDMGRVGTMMGDYDPFVGPVWAHGIHEVWNTWVNDNAPFDQIVGHIAPYMIENKKFFPGTPVAFADKAEVFTKNRVTYIENMFNKQVFVDPGYSKTPAYTVRQPYVRIEV